MNPQMLGGLASWVLHIDLLDDKHQRKVLTMHCRLKTVLPSPEPVVQPFAWFRMKEIRVKPSPEKGESGSFRFAGWGWSANTTLLRYGVDGETRVPDTFGLVPEGETSSEASTKTPG
jgi:hypothetical protein